MSEKTPSLTNTKSFLKIEGKCKETKELTETKMVKEYNKSLSTTSTSSVESGIYDMNDSYIETSAGEEITIGEAVEEILLNAQKECRLISGLNNASKYLKETENPDHSLFFFIAPSPTKDSLTHMQEVVLQAFCFESDIYIIKLDSAQKLNRILGLQRCESCALVQRSATLNIENIGDDIDFEKFTEMENILIDHCEDFWSEPIQPVIKLPEK